MSPQGTGVGGGWFNKTVRRVVPAVPTLSHRRWLMAPVDLVDLGISRLLGVSGELPPNRMRIRIGAGNRLLFNQIQHREHAVGFWMARLAEGTVSLDSRILDIGSGCGRYASVLMGTRFSGGPEFRGHYAGVDIDREMVEWCRGHFPGDRFSFLLADMASEVYNPGGTEGAEARVDLPDADRDFVFSTSLLTHLLEDDTAGYLRETARVLAEGGSMRMTVFCIEDLRETGTLGGRWTFRHRRGAAYIENEAYPEAAVAFEREWLLKTCAEAGLRGAEVIQRAGQSVLVARAGA